MDFDKLNHKIILTGKMTTGRRIVQKENIEGKAFLNYDVFTPLIFVSQNTQKPIISDKEASYILFDLIKANYEKYGFNNKYFTTPGSAEKLLECLNDYRLSENSSYSSLICANYDQLVKDYKEQLEKDKVNDYIQGLCEIESIKEFENTVCFITGDLELSPLENRVFSKIFKEICALETERITNPDIKAVYRCYGVFSEILNALDIIEKEKYPLSDCEIIYTDDEYENLLRGELESRRIKYVIQSAHAKSTNLISFMCDVIKYIKENFKYELLEPVFTNPGLKRLKDEEGTPFHYISEFYKTFAFSNVIVGYGYERTKLLIENALDDKPNLKAFLIDLLGFTDKDGNIDYNKFLDFVRRYVKANKEENILKNKLESLKGLMNRIPDGREKLNVLERELENLRYSETDELTDEGGQIVIGKVSKSFTLRKHLFVLGLNQTNLVSKVTENPFIENNDKYNDDLKDYEDRHSAENQKNKTVSSLDYFIHNSKSELYLSYSFVNKVNFRPSAISTYLMQLMKSNNIETTDIIKVNGYDISLSRIAFNNDSLIIPGNEEDLSETGDNGEIGEDEEKISKEVNEEEIDEIKVEDASEYKGKSLKSISASRLEPLITRCPYEFYYESILGIKKTEYPDLDEYQWLKSNESGTLVHEVFENYTNEELIVNKCFEFNQTTFDKFFDKAVKAAEMRNVDTSLNVKKKEIYILKKQAEGFMKNTILAKQFENGESKYKPLACEYDMSSLKFNIGGIEFHGFIDRVDGYVDDDKVLHIRLIDYKSGKEPKDTYIQHGFYSMVLQETSEKLFDLDYNSKVIDSFIYSYTKNSDKVYNDEKIKSCVNDIKTRLEAINNTKKGTELFDKLNEYFAGVCSNDGLCEFCKYKSVCCKMLNGERKDEKKSNYFSK